MQRRLALWSLFVLLLGGVVGGGASAARAQNWVVRYSGPGAMTDSGRAIAADGSGNVYVTGHSDGGGVTGYDFVTIKYNSAGVRQWIAYYDGPADLNEDEDNANALAADGSGAVYVTGRSRTGAANGYGYATVKYSTDGVEQWAQRYDNPVGGDANAYALAVDAGGNVYVTGESRHDAATGLDYATIKYSAPNWATVDVAVNRADNTSRLLWREKTNRYAVWSLSTTGAIQAGKYYGPISGYTCDQIVVAPNGQTTLLWKNPATRQAALWTLAPNLSFIVKATVYAYPADYTPQYIAADANSDLRLSWRRTDNAVALWTITPATGAVIGSAVYGPYANLQDGSLAVGADGRLRLLWRNRATGGATVWTLPATYGAPSAGYNYNPVAGAVASDIAVGADNKTRLQWSYAGAANGGKIAVWKINTAVGGTGAIEVGKFYGPLAGVSPLGLSVGGDNQTRQLWGYTTGKAALWVLNDPLTAITAAYTYGPLP